MQNKICNVKGCSKKACCKNLCKAHYHRLQRYGNPIYEPIKNRVYKECLIDGCRAKSSCHGLCSMHYQRMRRHQNSKNKRAEYGIYTKYKYEAQSYLSMIRRCTYISNPSYRRYGGAGITICPEWLGPNGLSNFLKDMGKRPQGKTLDRIDNSKGYSPDNCRWSSVKEQNRNRKTNIFYTYMGQTLVLADWAKKNNLRPEVVYYRWHKGERGKKLLRPSQKS